MTAKPVPVLIGLYTISSDDSRLKAYEQGARDYLENNLAENPFKPNQPECTAWQSGFDEADLRS